MATANPIMYLVADEASDERKEGEKGVQLTNVTPDWCLVDNTRIPQYRIDKQD